jgi:hypothetical protein
MAYVYNRKCDYAGRHRGTKAQREMKHPCCRGVLQYAPTKDNENPRIFG